MLYTLIDNKTMFSDDQNIDNLQQLYADIKKYIILQKDYTKLEIVEKMTILISTFTMVLVLGMIALFYLLFAFAHFLAPIVGGLQYSFVIIAGITFLLMAIAYFFRKKLFINPMVNFLANLFLNDSNK